MVREGGAPASLEVLCEEASNRVKDEAEELAAWPDAAVSDETTGGTLPPHPGRPAPPAAI